LLPSVSYIHPQSNSDHREHAGTEHEGESLDQIGLGSHDGWFDQAAGDPVSVAEVERQSIRSIASTALAHDFRHTVPSWRYRRSPAKSLHGCASLNPRDASIHQVSRKRLQIKPAPSRRTATAEVARSIVEVEAIDVCPDAHRAGS
jgi:hypothetical protein